MSKSFKIEGCRDCPRFEKRKVKYWLLAPPGWGWEYTCTKKDRIIMPSDGVKPPPSWCPLEDEDELFPAPPVLDKESG